MRTAALEQRRLKILRADFMSTSVVCREFPSYLREFFKGNMSHNHQWHHTLSFLGIKLGIAQLTE
jgi:hypothetical protein